MVKEREEWYPRNNGGIRAFTVVDGRKENKVGPVGGPNAGLVDVALG